MAKKKKKSVKKASPKSLTKKHIKHYCNSGKLNKTFGMTVIFDFAHIASALVLFMLLLAGVYSLLPDVAVALQSMQVLTPGTETTMTFEIAINQGVAAMQALYVKGALLLFGGVFLLLALTCTYKSFIWAHLTKQELTKKYFKNFFVTNFIWQCAWLLVAVLLFFILSVEFATYALLTELLLYLYFTPFLRAIFREKHTFKDIYRETFFKGVRHIPKFIVPIILMIVTVTFVMWLAIIIFQFIEPLATVLFVVTLILIGSTWVRFYFSIVAEHEVT